MARATKKNDDSQIAPEGVDPRQSQEAVEGRARTTESNAIVRIFSSALTRNPNCTTVIRSGSQNGARRMRQESDLRKVEALLNAGVRVNRAGRTVELSPMHKLKLESKRAELARKIQGADAKVRHGAAVAVYDLDDLAGALRYLIGRGKLNRTAVEASGIFPEQVIAALDAE